MAADVEHIESGVAVVESEDIQKVSRQLGTGYELPSGLEPVQIGRRFG